MTDGTAANERSGLLSMFKLMAAAREMEGQVQGDVRFTVAAANIRLIAGTLDQVSDASILKLASVNDTSEGLLSQLIAARLEQIGFALPLVMGAAEFFAPIEAKVDEILRGARPHMH